jgi:hypothetical protein
MYAKLSDSVADPHQCQFDSDPYPTFHFDADPDPTFHFDADPYPDPSLQVKANILVKVLKKCSNRLIFHTFRPVKCKPKRIRIQLITLMHIRMLASNLMRIHANPDAQHFLFVTSSTKTF